jgi:hypothetical protein
MIGVWRRFLHLSTPVKSINYLSKLFIVGNYGMSLGGANENYYDIEGWDDNKYYDEDSGLYMYTVNYNGIDYDKCTYVYIGGGFGGWVDQTNTYEVERCYRVPIGYDGAVAGLYDSGIEWEDGMHIYDVADENTLFFRLESGRR